MGLYSASSISSGNLKRNFSIASLEKNKYEPMKNLLFLTLAVILLASCAGPKYTYHFDHYDYNSGRKASISQVETAPLAVSTAELSASVNPAPSTVAPSKLSEQEIAEAQQTARKKYSDMSKAEKKEFRKEVKKEFRNYVKAVKKGQGIHASGEATAMDNDLKLAIIFGAVGLTLTLFGGINEAFWILGVIAIVVGVVFLIKWLVRQ
jgi:hypothetical protein